MLLSRGQAAEAIPHYEQTLKASPGDVNLRSDLADALARTRQLEKAGAELQQAHARLGSGEEAVAQTLRDWLKEYQSGRADKAPP